MNKKHVLIIAVLLFSVGLLAWLVAECLVDSAASMEQGSEQESKINTASREEAVEGIRTVAFDSREQAEDAGDEDSRPQLVVRVTDNRGQPLGGAQVELLSDSQARRVTDDDGDAQFDLSKPGFVAIRVSRTGFYGREIHGIPLADLESTLVECALIRTSRLVVRVRGPDGGPVPGATVWMGLTQPSARSSIPGRYRIHEQIATTGIDGIARFEDLAFTPYNIRATSRGYYDPDLLREYSVPHPGSQGLVDIALVAGREIEVTVISENDGTPISGAHVLLETSPRELPTTLPEKETDANGRVVFAARADTPYTAQVWNARGFKDWGAHISGSDSSVVVAMPVARARQVRIVTEHGNPVEEAVMERLEAGPRMTSKRLDVRNGLATLPPDVSARLFPVRIRSQAAVSAWVNVLGTNEDPLLFVVRRPCRFSGLLVDEGEGIPMRGVPVVARRVSSLSPLAGRGRDSYVEVSTATDSQGRYHLDLFADNLYRVSFGVPGRSVEDILVKVAAGEATSMRLLPGVVIGSSGGAVELPDARCRGGGVVEVAVFYKAKPLPFSNVWLIPAKGEHALGLCRMAVADHRGVAEFRGVPAGKYGIAPAAPGLLNHFPPVLGSPVDWVRVSPGQLVTHVIKR